jgi:hypothetical protein
MCPGFVAESMMFLGSQVDNTDRTIVCGVIVYLGMLAAILLCYLFIAQIESVIGSGGHGPSPEVTGR